MLLVIGILLHRARMAEQHERDMTYAAAFPSFFDRIPMKGCFRVAATKRRRNRRCK
jgi:hypothetical protein